MILSPAVCHTRSFFASGVQHDGRNLFPILARGVYCSSAARLFAQQTVPVSLTLSFLPLLLPLWLFQAELPSEIPKQNPYTSAADIGRGRRLFRTNCAVCHGPEGTGGRGANLAQPRLRRAPDDQDLFLVIRQGIPGTEMPPGWWVLDEHEMWQVAAYVRSLGRVAPERVPGDARAGSHLFRTTGCIGCHQVALEGGRLGPTLTGIGSRRGASYLRGVLLDPASSLPEEFLQVQAVTADGKRVMGIRLNEDTWSIQLRDLSDHLLSFWKEDLASLEKQPGRSPMPSYRQRLSDRELDGLVAYLVSLRGDR
jgi:cytochrome c oxidase cbb3-type subunit III